MVSRLSFHPYTYLTQGTFLRSCSSSSNPSSSGEGACLFVTRPAYSDDEDKDGKKKGDRSESIWTCPTLKHYITSEHVGGIRRDGGRWAWDLQFGSWLSRGSGARLSLGLPNGL